MENNNMRYIITVLTILMAILLLCSLSTISAANQSISNTTAGGIKTAVNNVNNWETVTLNPGTYSGNNNTGITVNKSVTIRGNGPTNQVVIDAKKTNRIFTITGGCTVTFINVTFANGYAVNHGGTIYSNATMAFYNCEFINCTANSGSGSAIYNNHGSVTISYSTFRNSMEVIGSGAIYNNGGNVTVSNSNFINNTAIDKSGAAIYNDMGRINV